MKLRITAALLASSPLFISQAFAMGNKPPRVFPITQSQTQLVTDSLCRDGENSHTTSTQQNQHQTKLIVTDISVSRARLEVFDVAGTFRRSGNKYQGPVPTRQVIGDDGSRTVMTGTLYLDLDGSGLVIDREIATDDGLACRSKTTSHMTAPVQAKPN